jgi:hypothetical protein
MKALPATSFRVAPGADGKVSIDAVQVALERAFHSQGMKVKLNLLPSDVHDPTEIPTYLAGYKPFMFRADQASPVILVDHDEDKYRQFSSDDTFRRVDVKGSQTQLTTPEVDPTSSLTNYKVVNRFIGSFVPDQTESNATNPNYRPRFAAARRCRRAIDLDREIDVWALLGLTTSFASGQRVALTADQKWNGGASSNPILDLQTMLEVSAQQITEFWMNQKTANAFIRHDKVKDHFRMFMGDSALQGTINDIGNMKKQVDFAIPGIGVMRVAAAKVKNETTGNLDYVLADGIVVATVVPDSSFPLDGEEIATTYTFRRKGPSGTGYEAREFRIENRGPLGGTMVVISMADIAVITANNAGAILSGAVA